MIRTGTLNVEEVDVMSGSVDHGPEGHRVGHLSVEPDVLVGRESPGETGADDTDDVPQHGDEDQATIECENKTCTSRRPHGPRQCVQSKELLVRFLRGMPLA